MRSESEYIGDLYARLDAERERVNDAYLETLRGEGRTAMERDEQARLLAKEIKRLHVADSGLCFGRLDSVNGERSYIGRLGIFDEADDYEPLLLDWRAPASRAFYTATGATPEGMRRRRQFHSKGRALVEFTDEAFDGHQTGAVHSDADAALLAAVNAPRGEGMRDIVATIQSEQDEIIRLEHQGVLVIEGGPGTGKTVVALHRAAYLLYTQRERMERSGVLVVGPNPQFLNHIGRVLPSLGESAVVFMTAGDLVPGLRVAADDNPEAARLKGSLEILDFLKQAIADRQRLPETPVPVEIGGVRLHVDAAMAEWARDEARKSGLPHNEARSTFTEILSYVLTERAIGRIGKGWLSRDDKKQWEEMRSTLLKELADSDRFIAALDELWPLLSPRTFLAELYTTAEGPLWRADGSAWTVSDVPLLDELVDLLGPDRSAADSAERESRAEADYATQVLDMLMSRQDSMDDEDHLYATDLLEAHELAFRFQEHDTRDLVERASSDRDWTYRHVVVDEAQELSAMDWRVLMRRCPARSFTVVGDLAQRRSEAGARTWGEMLDPYVPGRWVYRPLSMNYRTPAEIMELAAAVLADFAPDVTPPESVRSCGVRPWSRRVTDIAAAVEEFVRDEAGREGTSIVIGPPGVPGTVPASETKGLEFDAVLVVEPERILADGPRGASELYVALTRATQRLGVLHTGELPPSLAGMLIEAE
ncbi:DUF2075 domain-containing protein [Pseudonocardiaceae bacterium YIM PH 21723]|nr:DUF2075 domain-containing protein [Pseudonocardiaceae bacterium YIM PH 21723]